MALQRALITDFTAGELSPKFSGRFDTELYGKGNQVVENWVPFTQGGVRTRPGIEYLGVTEDGAKARFIPFVVNESNAFSLELTNNLIRIWKDGVLVGAPTEVVTTYTTAQLFQIQYQKVRNVLYLVHYSHPIATLTWDGGTAFTLANLTIDFADGVDAWAATTAYVVDDMVTNGNPMKIYRWDFNYFNMITYTTKQLKAEADWANPLVPETEDISYTRSVYGEGGAFFFEIASDEDDDIYWMIGADALIIGTCSAEWVLPDTVTALNIKPKRRSGLGSAFLQATMFQDAPVFAQGTLAKALLREYPYLSQSPEIQSPDLTFGADHMLENGITQMAVAKMPQPTLFAVTNGELAALLYNKAYGVLAWYHITTAGGTIESVCVVPGTTDDEVYISVNRASGRVVGKFDHLWATTDIPLDSYVDIAAIAGATQNGLARFNNETVTIYNITDSTIHTAAVAAGSLTYPAGDGVGDHVVIGMAFTCRGQTMRLNTQIQTGTGQGQTKRMVAVTARVLESMPFKAGYAEAVNLETSQKSDGSTWATAYTGDIHIPVQGTPHRDAWVWFIQDQPYRTTILALIPEVAA